MRHMYREGQLIWRSCSVFREKPCESKRALYATAIPPAGDLSSVTDGAALRADGGVVRAII
jgi:hypothetical protein